MRSDSIRSLQLGKVPRVVGTIISAEFLEQWSSRPYAFPCDLVELRVDGFSSFPRWLEIGTQLEQFGIPVLATVRISAEGGKWTGDEQERKKLLLSAVENLSGIDVELNSSIAFELTEFAKARGKICILSHHNFQLTPSAAELRNMVARMQDAADVAKIAATANSIADVETLRSILHQPWKVPICIIGMGPFGRETRLRFPLEGSCFTYGYLDQAGAPGQYSARELSDYLHEHSITK